MHSGNDSSLEPATSAQRDVEDMVLVTVELYAPTARLLECYALLEGRPESSLEAEIAHAVNWYVETKRRVYGQLLRQELARRKAEAAGLKVDVDFEESTT
jgi:hypothetical protein